MFEPPARPAAGSQGIELEAREMGDEVVLPTYGARGRTGM